MRFRKAGDPGDGLCGRVDTNLMLLKPLQLFQRPLRRQIAVGGLEPLSHHPVENQRDEANTGVRPDTLGQAMKHRGTPLPEAYIWPKLNCELGSPLSASALNSLSAVA